jgi:hypothetical protein
MPSNQIAHKSLGHREDANPCLNRKKHPQSLHLFIVASNAGHVLHTSTRAAISAPVAATRLPCSANVAARTASREMFEIICLQLMPDFLVILKIIQEEF